MNERIRELAHQARQIGEYGNYGQIQLSPTQFEQKFAELIVRECLDIVAMRIYLGPEEICRQECKALASEIKEHFGVAE